MSAAKSRSRIGSYVCLFAVLGATWSATSATAQDAGVPPQVEGEPVDAPADGDAEGADETADTEGDAEADGEGQDGEGQDAQPEGGAAEGQDEEPDAEGQDGETDPEEYTEEDYDAVLGLSLEDLLSPQVVSASLLQEDAWEALAIISVVSAEAMREYGYLSVGEALRYEPGLYPVYDLVTYNVGIRGVNGGMGAQSQVLRTMLDGRDIRFRPTGGSLLGPELIPRLGIRQVEIVRGPVSALYGADAFLGAINVIPNTAADMGPGHARLELNTLSQGPNWGIQADGAVWGTPFDIDSVVSVSYRDLDRGGLRLPESSPTYGSLTSVLGTDRVPEDRERAASALGRFTGNWDDGSLTLETNFQYFERGANFNFESSPLSGGRASLYTLGATIRFDQNIDDKVRIRAFTGYSRGGPTDRERLVDRFVIATIPYLQRTLDYQTSESRAEITYSDQLPDIPVHFAVTLGGDYTFDYFDAPSVLGIRPAPQEPLPLSPPSEVVQFHNGAGFLQLRVRIFDWLRILGGLRVEGHTLYGDQTSYRAGIGYADENLSVRLLYGRSFKAPSVFLLYAEPVIAGGPERNPDLDPQYAQTGELNVSYRPERWLTFSATGFISEIDALARIEATGLTPRARNAADILSYGAEAEIRLDHRASGFEGFLNFAWAHAEEVTNDVTARSPLYPEFTFYGGVQYHLRDPGMRFVVMNRLVSSRRADPSNALRNGGVDYEQPLYDILTVGVYSEGLQVIDGLTTELGLRFENVLLQNYAEPGFLGIDVPGEAWSLRVTVSQQL